jgi:hypothetical protein
LDGCPPKYAKELYLAYARLEEDHGLARHAMAVYERAVSNVAPEDKLEVFKMYIRKAAELFGVTRTREIYEKAIEMLPDSDAAAICTQYAQLEVRVPRGCTRFKPLLSLRRLPVWPLGHTANLVIVNERHSLAVIPHPRADQARGDRPRARNLLVRIADVRSQGVLGYAHHEAEHSSLP